MWHKIKLILTWLFIAPFFFVYAWGAMGWMLLKEEILSDAE